MPSFLAAVLLLAWCCTAWNIPLTSSDQLLQQCSLPAPCSLPAYSLGESRVKKWERLGAVQACSAIAATLVCCQPWLNHRSKQSTVQAAVGKADSIPARPSPNACPGGRRGLRHSPHAYSFIPRLGRLPWRDSLGTMERKFGIPVWGSTMTTRPVSATCVLVSLTFLGCLIPIFMLLDSFSTSLPTSYLPQAASTWLLEDILSNPLLGHEGIQFTMFALGKRGWCSAFLHLMRHDAFGTH